MFQTVCIDWFKNKKLHIHTSTLGTPPPLSFSFSSLDSFWAVTFIVENGSFPNRELTFRPCKDHLHLKRLLCFFFLHVLGWKRIYLLLQFVTACCISRFIGLRMFLKWRFLSFFLVLFFFKCSWMNCVLVDTVWFSGSTRSVIFGWHESQVPLDQLLKISCLYLV